MTYSPRQNQRGALERLAALPPGEWAEAPHPEAVGTLWLLEIIGALEATSYMRTHAAFRITAGGRELLATLKLEVARE